MTIDTSREAVERLARDHMTVGDCHKTYVMGHPHHWKTAQVLTALLAERDAALAEVARLSQALAEAEANINLKADFIDSSINDSAAMYQRAIEAEEALAAETAKREAMEAALEPFADESLHVGPEHTFVAVPVAACDAARATLAEHGSKT